jgi:hypothetical protein
MSGTGYLAALIVRGSPRNISYTLVLALSLRSRLVDEW